MKEECNVKKLILILSMLLLVGCTVEGKVSDKSILIGCTDTRDGETFYYTTSNIKNARIGFGGADSCFDVVDQAGRGRHLCKSHEAWLKCGKR